VDVATKALHELKLPIRHAADGKEYALAIAAWAPEGNWFAAGDEGLLYLVEIKNRTGPVWSWSGRGRLTKDPHQILGGTCFFSPDGRKVLFVTVDEGSRMALQTAEIKGGEERLLVAPGEFTDLFACWSPQGDRIAFSGARLDASGKRAGQSGIYVIPADGSSADPAPVLEEFHPPEQFRLRLVDWR
jgi:dipeptidyl aminopeptidase/acylaminoacyl peptidase